LRRLAARTGLRPPTIAIVVILLVGLTSVAVVTTVLRSIDRNAEAIEVGCLVVVQVVRDSGANSGKPVQTKAGRAQARITARFYATLLGQMSPKSRRAVLRDQAIVRRAGGAIPEPQCKRIADDPDKVRRDTLQTQSTRRP
jgi:hypothetical protein